jgi:hypothetical protein
MSIVARRARDRAVDRAIARRSTVEGSLTPREPRRVD